MHLSLSGFPHGTRIVLAGDDAILYGADGREWARIVERDGKITPFPTSDLPAEYSKILEQICNTVDKSV